MITQTIIESELVVGYCEVAEFSSFQTKDILFVSVQEGIEREMRGDTNVIIVLHRAANYDYILKDERERIQSRLNNDKMPDGWGRDRGKIFRL